MPPPMLPRPMKAMRVMPITPCKCEPRLMGAALIVESSSLRPSRPASQAPQDEEFRANHAPHPEVRGVAEPRRTHSALPRRLAELVDELVGLAADRRVKDAQLAGVGRVPQHAAFAFEDEAGGGDLALDRLGVDAVQGLGV